ncbi:hypothetical protein ACSBR2_021883 [Camellia fascicularis]
MGNEGCKIKKCDVGFKLRDFGLARLVDHGKDSQTTILAVTKGYMAPECLITDKSNKESDVYSFGVVALEIACGRKPTDLEILESQMRIVEQAIHVLNFETILPILPSKMPVPTYLAPPMNASSLVSLTYGSTTISNSNQVQSSSYSYNTNFSKFNSSSASSSPSASLLYT